MCEYPRIDNRSTEYLSYSKKKVLAIYRSTLGKFSTWFLANVDFLALHICAPVP